MDIGEATKTLMARIQGLDPEYGRKIMGYILVQDPGEKELIRLALGPDSVLINLMNKVKSHLGLLSNTSSANFPSVFNPPRRSLLNPSSPRILIPTSPSSPWSAFSPKPQASSSPSYAALNGGASFEAFSPHDDLHEDFTNVPVQSQDPLFLDTKNINFMDSVMSPSARSDSVLFPYDNCTEIHHHSNLHRRSFSVSDMYVGGGDCSQYDDDNNGGWKPCMYFAKGFCKNGSDCKFMHESPDATLLGSPKMDGLDDFLTFKALQQQQQRFAAASQLMAGGGAPFPYNRCINILNENQRSAAAALMMGEEYHKFGRCRPDRNDFGSSSRQIYLTFPADSTFKDDDVSRYFGAFGLVQDVRIPHQQKRMFGFVTFLYTDTVKQILAHGNPHFVCNSRVLVKPYKEKGKILDKKQQMERGDFAECLSPSGLDPGEPYDLPFGGRVVYNSDEIMLRRKLEEQTDLQEAIECQRRRLMNFQLMNLRNHQPSFPLRPHFVAGVPTHSPTHSHGPVNQNCMFLSDDINPDDLEGSIGEKDEAISPTTETDQKIQAEVNDSANNENVNFIGNDKEESSNREHYDPHGSFEHALPDNLFASPTKSTSDRKSLFCAASAESDGSIPVTTTSFSSNNVGGLPATSSLTMASPKCYFETPSH